MTNRKFRCGTRKRRIFDSIDEILLYPKFHQVRNPVAVALALMLKKDQALILAVRSFGLPKQLAAKLMGLTRHQIKTRLRRSENLIRFVADALIVKEVWSIKGKTWEPNWDAVGKVA